MTIKIDLMLEVRLRILEAESKDGKKANVRTDIIVISFIIVYVVVIVILSFKFSRNGAYFELFF